MTGVGRAGHGFRIGVIADTHGMLPPAAEEALRGVDAILHAGDVGEGFILEVLGAIAPVTAVRGNNRYASERDLPATVVVRLGGVVVGVAHRAHDVPHTDARTGELVRVAVSGHTHRGSVVQDEDVLLVNPGSPCDPRGGTPASVAVLTVGSDGAVRAQLVPVRR